MTWTLGFHSSICFSWKQAWVSLMNTPTTQTKILHVHKCRNSYTWSSQKHQAQCSRINQNQFNNQENQEFILHEHKMSQVVAQVCMFRQNGLKSYCTWHGSCYSTVTVLCIPVCSNTTNTWWQLCALARGLSSLCRNSGMSSYDGYTDGEVHLSDSGPICPDDGSWSIFFHRPFFAK